MSATAVTTEVVTVLGVLGIGSILGQYVASSKDRRETRARVLTALAAVESARWAGLSEKTPIEFETSLREFHTAALIGRVPRDAAWEYAVLAQAARWVSQENSEHDPDPGGGIDTYLAQATREAARAIAVIAWSSAPTHTWHWRRAKKRIDEALTKLQSDSTRKAVSRSREHGFM
jgi:hypothetical protein